MIMIRLRKMEVAGLTRWEVSYYDEAGIRRRRKFATEAAAVQFRAELLRLTTCTRSDPNRRLMFTVPFVACKRHISEVLQIKKVIGQLALDRADNRHYDRPCRVKITAFHMSRRGKDPLWRMPDLDNIAKAALDAMNGCIYRDDQQVFELILKRIISAEERTLIEVEFLSEGDLIAAHNEHRFRHAPDTQIDDTPNYDESIDA